MSKLWVNNNGTWVSPTNTWVNDNGTWKKPSKIWFNDNGTWKSISTTASPSPTITLSNGITIGRTNISRYYDGDSTTSVMNSYVASEFGSNWVIADWNDFNLSQNEQTQILLTFGINPADYTGSTDINIGFVSYNGVSNISGRGAYYISFQNHIKPSYFGAYGNYNNYWFTLGNWYGDGIILCKRI